MPKGIQKVNDKKTVSTPQPADHLKSLASILVVTVVAVSLLGLLRIGIDRLEADVARAGTDYLTRGSVLGAAIVKREASLAVTGGGVERSYAFNLVGRTTAYDFLVRASLKDAFPIQVKQYDFGAYIEGIDGVVGDAKNFWALYVNGQQSPVGANSLVVEDGDRVEFRWEAVR